MAKFMKPDDYILSRIGAYPTLYCSDSYDASKLRVLDQLLNVIGNGIRDDEELDEDLRVVKFDRDRAMRICSGEPVYYGYFKVLDFGSGFSIGEGDSITALESEKDLHPTVVHWMEAGGRRSSALRGIDSEYRWSPYPNFQKQYSTIWQTDFEKLGPEWAEAVVWFYTKCQEYFAGDHSNYHSAYPCETEAKTQRLLDDMATWQAKYDSNEKFAEAYLGAGATFDGDMNAFLVDRWARTRAEIDAFITEAIEKFS